MPNELIKRDPVKEKIEALRRQIYDIENNIKVILREGYPVGSTVTVFRFNKIYDVKITQWLGRNFYGRNLKTGNHYIMEYTSILVGPDKGE